MQLSIVIPTLNESARIEALLARLQPWRTEGVEVIVVDGGSRDGTLERAAPWVDRIVQSASGRARQMNAGAAAARGEVLWFLHADTLPPSTAMVAIRSALAASPRMWGRFDVRLSGATPVLRLVETLMNLRSWLTGIATGDQGIFVRREAFAAVGGFADIALMEDIAISRRLKRLSPPIRLRERLLASSRRWEEEGVWRTIFLMWRLRLAYFLGADPGRLVERYYGNGRSRAAGPARQP